MTKRLISFVLALAMLLGFGATANAQDTISVTLDGKVLSFDQNPVIVEGRTLVPLRGIFEAMGATVDWNDSTRTVSAVKDGITVLLTIGDNTLYRNGEAISLDVPAQIVNSRTLVPARAVSESFGARVDWNGDTRNVIISTDEVLNAALENMNNAGEIVFDISVNASYGEVPVKMDAGMGTDYVNEKYFMHYSIDMGFAETQITMVSSDTKTYIDEDGEVTVAEEQMVEEFLPFGDVYVFDSENETEKIYSVTAVTEDGTQAKVKFYADKQTLTFTKLSFPKEIITAQGLQTEDDILCTIKYNIGETMELWNKYSK